MDYKKIVIAGGGVLGSQIAFQTAYCGYDVTILSREEDIEDSKNKLSKLKDTYQEVIKKMNTKEGKSFNEWARGISDYDDFDEKKCLKKVENAYKNIKLEIDKKKALENADLVIESITENLDIKKSFYESIETYLPQKAVIVTNSSTLLPSKLAKSTKRKEKFLSMHFANSIWKNNITEIMVHPKTDKKYFDEIIEFAKTINMIPLPIYKEKSGYLLNSMLVPFLFSGLDLYVNGISEPESIDKAWTLGTGAPKGPFRILDTVGLVTAYNIVKMYLKIPSFLAPYNFKGMAKLLKKYIDEGKLGVSSGEGFYKYNDKK